MSICHSTGQSMEVTLMPPSLFCALTPQPSGALAPLYIVTCCPLGRLLSGCRKLDVDLSRGSRTSARRVQNVGAQLPGVTLRSTWKYNLHSGVPRWGRASATLWRTLPEIAPLLSSPGRAALINKSLARELLSQGSASAELELTCPTYTKSQSSSKSVS